MSDYYDIHGNAITINEWTTARAGGDWQAAKRSTKVNDQTDVSTVWLGMDHSWGSDGPPLIFESMIFGGNLDQEQVRYSTMEQAHAGHDALVEKARSEREAFVSLASDPMVNDCVKAIEQTLAAHREVFGLGEYGADLYAALVKAVTS